uniref:Butyrophilin subfamily 1 member A1-like n=1 Tax=Sphenodon punctatus TaxID=8508 RepID=A0A8D0G7A7_SPHPU
MAGSSFFQSSRCSSLLPDIIVFLVAFNIMMLESDGFTLIGPGRPITALAGQDAELPCHLPLSMNAENMEVRWFRQQFSTYVHLYRDGKDHYETQMPEYRGRTKLPKGGLRKGIVSLRILNIRDSDFGQYRCVVQNGGDQNETMMELKAAVLGSDLLIAIEGYLAGGIHVVCRSGDWYLEPEVWWKDPSGNHLLPLSKTIKKRVDNGLFDTESSIIILKEQSRQRLSCCVGYPLISQGKETEICIEDSFFPGMNLWMVSLVVLLPILLGAIAFILYRYKLERKRAAELRWRKFVAPIEQGTVTLDPDTAHPRLILSEDQKSVKWGDIWQNLPENPQRFDAEYCVLGCDGFTTGRHYWEVEVGESRHWFVGVARESVRRKGGFCFSPEKGIWVVGQSEDQYQVCTSPETLLSLSGHLKRIRVFLDCTGGQVAFFNADTGASVFSFPLASFTGERIYPWFWVDARCQLRLCF